MLSKKEVSKEITRLFPDIEFTKLAFGTSKVDEWVESSLLPFLFYQNTVDSKHRVVNLFLPESSISKNMVPIYIAMGFYRKAIERAQNKSIFKNNTFLGESKQVVTRNNSKICSIRLIDFISQNIRLNDGSCIDFDSMYKLNWELYRNAKDVKEQIDSYLKIGKNIKNANNGNIFNFHIQPNETDYEGAIIFTNVNDFISKLRSTKVCGENILDYIHIKKVIYCKDTESYKVETISSKRKTSDKPVSILVSSLDNAYDFKKIISSLAPTLNHIKTVIWDDFDDILKLKKNESVNFDDDVIGSIKTNYFDRVIDKSLKDIYLINKNHNIDIHSIIKKLELGDVYYPWLLKPAEKLAFEESDCIKSQIIISVIDNSNYYITRNRINDLINSWKQLATDYSLGGEVIKNVSFLYELLDKMQTFYDIENLNSKIISYCGLLDEFKNQWFQNNQDCGIIDSTVNLCNSFVAKNLNFKIPIIENELNKIQLTNGTVIIFSKNQERIDQLYLEKKLNNSFSNLKFVFKTSSDIIKESPLCANLPSAVFYLDFRGKLQTAPFINIYSKNQIFVIDNQELNYLKKTHNYNKKIFSEVSSDSNKLALLNLDGSQYILNDENIEFIMPVEKQISEVEKVDEFTINSLEAFVKSIFKNNIPLANKTSSKLNEYIVFFDDGSTLIEAHSKKVFVFDETNSLDQSWISIEALQPNNEILTLNRGGEIKDLINELLLKKESYSPIIRNDKKWRDHIKNYMINNSLDLQSIADVFTNNGFKIHEMSIDNWIDGYVSTPQKFKELLILLSKLGIININDVVSIYESNKKLKEIKITFVRESVKKIICELKGIPYYSENTLVDSETINKLASYISIKKVKFVNKL